MKGRFSRTSCIFDVLVRETLPFYGQVVFDVLVREALPFCGQVVDSGATDISNKALVHETWKIKKDVISRATSGHPFVFVLGTGIEPILQD